MPGFAKQRNFGGLLLRSIETKLKNNVGTLSTFSSFPLVNYWRRPRIILGLLEELKMYLALVTDTLKE